MKLLIPNLFSAEDVPMSLSAKKPADETVNTLDTLIPVQLPEEDMKAFVKAFHPKRPAKAPAAFLEEVNFLVEVSAFLNSIFIGLRYGVSRAHYDKIVGAQLGDLITREIDVTLKASLELDKRAKEFLMALSAGNHHIIKDSTRYKGGKDIIYVGLRGPNVSPLLSSGHPDQLPMPLLTTSYSYEDRKDFLDSDLGKAFVATGLAIQKLFFEASDVEKLDSAFARINKQHTIGPNHTIIPGLTKIFMSGPLAKAGIPITLPVFTGVQTEHSVERLKEYCSVLALREPNHTLVVQRLRAGKEVPSESLAVCTEYQALQPDIRFSIVLNIPKNFCEYITQTKEEQIPLVPLNTWATVWSAAMLRPPKTRSSKESRGQKDQGTRILIPERAPKYVLRPSASDELIKRRKELGLYSESGRITEDGIFITYNGDLAFMNSATDSATDNAKAYEAISEEALALSFDAGTPLAAGQKGSTGAIFELASPSYAQKITALKDQLHKYKGSVQAINWDLNTVITVSVASPDHVVATKLVGANKPDALNLAAYLRSTFSSGMRDMFSRTKQVIDGRRFAIDESTFQSPNAILQSSVFINFANVYNHFLSLDKVPGIESLVKQAAEALKIASLDDEAVADYELNFLDRNRTIYSNIIRTDLTADTSIRCGQTLITLLAIAVKQASASGGTNLARICIRDGVEFSEHDRYFDGSSPVGDFQRVYTWLGGQVFFQALKALLKIPHKDLLAIGEPAAPGDDGGHPGFLSISNEVMPMAVLLGKYTIPSIRDKIYEQADSIKEAETKFSEQDLNLAGSKGKNVDGKGGMKLFPHQAESLIRLKAHPKIAILDIAPGGGKTTIGIADIAMLYADGLIKRPFVFAPNRLVRNWIEDCHKSFKGWNVIPITTETYKLWGEVRLTEMIQKAPPNTIVVVGNSFISNTPKTQLVIGNAVDQMSNSVEFIKKFEPDYIIIDESHRIRNPRSAIHQGIKTINQMSSVKYGRIATGTLIQNVLSDVVGQSAIFNGQIFRTVDEFETSNKGVVAIVNDKQIIDYKEDTPLKARRRLAEFATVISFKRKEWAFMLPNPVETFVLVKMDEHGDSGHKLQQFYNAVLKQTLEEAKNDPRLKKTRGKKDEDDDDDSDDSTGDDHTITTANGISLEVTDSDDDSDDSDDLEAALQPYLQRLERLLTDPFGDPELLPVAKEIFGNDFDPDYVSPKVAKCIERIYNHFKEIPWVKGKLYKGSEMVDFNGKSYIFKSELASGDGEEVSDKSPDSDPERWKLQIRGKVFIACRYTRSVDAIFRALPKDLKDKAVRFHGEVDSKDDNLAAFQNDPKCQILIANEMGVSEGHNFQMASRFIRVEAPWAPGELDQTAARIFRPDVGGEYIRQAIFLDWLLCNDTLEVAKMGRLISKMLKRTKFDELDNPKYYKNLNPNNLPVIKMSLDNIRELHNIDDLCSISGEGSMKDGAHENSYIGQYGYLVNQMGSEFREMRRTKRAYMIDVEPTPMPKGSSKLEFTPWVPNLHVEDLNNDGLIPLRDALDDENSVLARAFKKDRKALLGQYVRTEFGLGVIDKVTTRNGKSTDEDDGDDDTGNEISKVRVKLIQGGGVEMLSASKVYLATNITEQNKTKYNDKAPKITAADKKRTEAAKALAEAALARIKAREEKAKARLAALKKPVEVIEDEEDEEENAKEIYLYPVVYNEFLALEGSADIEHLKELKRFGFEKTHDYAAIKVTNYTNFTGLLDFLEKKYTLLPKVVKYLDMLHDSFQSGRGRKFQVELSPYSELPIFHRMQARPTLVKNRRKPELQVYPILRDGVLFLVVDLVNNLVFRRELKKAIPGVAGATFQEFDGMFMHFFKNKAELKTKVAELRKVGKFVIANYDELKSETDALSLKAALTNK